MSDLYIIASDEVDRVKIGRSSSPLQRMSDIQTGSPCVVRMVRVFGGCGAVETEVHQVFAPYRFQGEWFDRVGSLCRFLGALELVPEPTTPATVLTLAWSVRRLGSFEFHRNYRSLRTGMKHQRALARADLQRSLTRSRNHHREQSRIMDELQRTPAGSLRLLELMGEGLPFSLRGLEMADHKNRE